MNDAISAGEGKAGRGSRPGRPAVLDAEKRLRIVAMLTLGCSRRVAARHVGCSPSTITRTAARDATFADQLARAEANLEVELLSSIRHAAKKDRYWRAAGWILERKNPVDYTPRPAHLYTADQVIQLFLAALDSLREELGPAERDRAITKLGALLVEFEPGSGEGVVASG